MKYYGANGLPGDRDPVRNVTEVSYAGTVLTLDQAKQALNITDTGDATYDADTNARVQRTLNAVSRWCDHAVHRTYGTACVRRLHMDIWPKAVVMFGSPPLLTVDSVTYIDANDQSQTVDPSEYTVLAPSYTPGLLEFDDGFAYPALACDRMDAVTIEYTSGIADAADIPAEVLEAASLMLGYYWDPTLPPAEQAATKQAAIDLMASQQWGDYG